VLAGGGDETAAGGVALPPVATTFNCMPN
jgi:hypothetical protein